jgi:hypothetical protein
MKIFLQPQHKEGTKLEYSFSGEVVTVLYGEEVDVFDFTGLPNGYLDDIETTLPYNPIVSARRELGILYLELLNFIPEDATEEERFPQWKDVVEIG